LDIKSGVFDAESDSDIKCERGFKICLELVWILIIGFAIIFPMKKSGVLLKPWNIILLPFFREATVNYL
jgi:hypothetical protein